jgi:hypothetical protein
MLLHLRELRWGQVDEVNAVGDPLVPNISDGYQVGITWRLVHDLLEDQLRLVLGVDDFHSGILGVASLSSDIVPGSEAAATRSREKLGSGYKLGADCG